MKNEGLINILNSDNYEDVKLGIGILNILKDSDYNLILDRLRFGKNSKWHFGLNSYLVRSMLGYYDPHLLLRYKF